MKREMLILCLTAACVAGCSSSGQQQSAEKYQGRDETRKLEAASAAGYDGTAVRKSVDTMLNRNDDHNGGLDNALKAGSDGESAQK